MNNLIELIQQPWPWYVAGTIIAIVMFALLYFGNSFGLSANFRNMCSMLGGGRSCDFFDFDWRKQTWNLLFLAGTVIGGFIAHQYLMPDATIAISEATVAIPNACKSATVASDMAIPNARCHYCHIRSYCGRFARVGDCQSWRGHCTSRSLQF